MDYVMMVVVTGVSLFILGLVVYAFVKKIDAKDKEDWLFVIRNHRKHDDLRRRLVAEVRAKNRVASSDALIDGLEHCCNGSVLRACIAIARERRSIHDGTLRTILETAVDIEYQRDK